MTYIEQLENFQAAPTPVNYLYLILSEINYAFYQSYLYAARNYPSTISACSQFNPDTQTTTWRTCVENILKDEYGVHVDRYSFTYDDPQRDSRLQYNIQLTYIFNAIENIGSSLKSVLIEALEQCQQLAQNNNIPFTINIDDFRGWTAAQTFKRIFDKQGLIDIRFDFSKTYSSTSTQPEVPNPRILLANSAFVSSTPNDPIYNEATVRGIISHEFGHMFINFLGTSLTAWQMTINPRNVNDQPIQLIVTTGGGGSGEPLVSEGYLQAINGYYAGINVDFGAWFRSGGYSKDDDRVCALTNVNYGLNVACIGCDANQVFLVDQNKNCIPDVSNNNHCIPFVGSTEFPCIPSTTFAQENAVYARLAGTYIATYADGTNQDLFSNERGVTTATSAPKEGLADLFKVSVSQGGITQLPTIEPRRTFFEENINNSPYAAS